ncbi:MAG: M14 family metallocarboxypeptidase [Oscillospiraceae bacterium]|nr:M14 family metallocarboxypeptidase [Oscillospiraceae bacterium]
MAIVPTNEPTTAGLAVQSVERLLAEYPFLRGENIGTTAFRRPVWSVCIGTGPRTVLYSGAHHANEWITATVLLKFLEDYAAAIVSGGNIGDVSARELSERTTVCVVPMVNPDGVDLVTGVLQPNDEEYERALGFARNYPNIPFPDGWKANLNGVDLNLQYPAGWLRAREIKFRQGYTSPAPRDYVGRAPLNQVESLALYDYTNRLRPELVLAYHTQGGVIYYQYGGIEVPGAEELAQRFASLSGYEIEEVPFASSFAGYKDWFIQAYRRPGFTIEAGRGVNPLPIDQFEEIYRDNLPILVTAATG